MLAVSFSGPQHHRKTLLAGPQVLTEVCVSTAEL